MARSNACCVGRIRHTPADAGMACGTCGSTSARLLKTITVKPSAGSWLGTPMGAWLGLGLAVLTATHAHAKWQLVDDQRDALMYVDRATISRRDSMATMWTLLDYRREQTSSDKKYHSVRRQDEYDCTNRRSRLLATAWFSGKMATGKLVYTSTRSNHEWHPVIPGNASAIRWQIACGKSRQDLAGQSGRSL